MASIDPVQLAKIRARQDYQEKLDVYNNAEERRLKRQANLRMQVIWGMVVLLLVVAFFYFGLRDFTFPAWIYVVPFFAGTEFFLIVAFLATLRPNPKPIAPTEIAEA